MKPNDFQLVSINKALPNDLSRLVDLHMATMETLLSELGEPMVSRFYLNAAKDPQVIGLYALKDGKIAGWAMGSADPSGLFKKLADRPVWFLTQLSKLTLTRPSAIAHLLGSLLQPEEDELKPGDFELTYIGVDTSSTRQGIGRYLLDAFCIEVKSCGHKRVLLSVEQENSAAISLYKSFGFTILREFKEGQFSRYRMCLLLDDNFVDHKNETR